jgi:protocatechuate 3,4-dioxygenase beta subunit
LFVSGTIVSAHSCAPIAGAVLDVWQTDERGWYSNLSGLGNPRDEKTFDLRGKFQTDSTGAYRFETILPGYYPLGPFKRPRHIHFRVEHPAYQTLFTQLYFEGDPVLKRSLLAKKALIRPLTPRANPAEGNEVMFDIVLCANTLLTSPLKNVKFQLGETFGEAQDPTS